MAHRVECEEHGVIGTYGSAAEASSAEGAHRLRHRDDAVRAWLNAAPDTLTRAALADVKRALRSHGINTNG